MKSYTVRAILTQALEIDVRANSEEEARKKADRIDINDWCTVEDLDFDIETIEEVA